MYKLNDIVKVIVEGKITMLNIEQGKEYCILGKCSEAEDYIYVHVPIDMIEKVRYDGE